MSTGDLLNIQPTELKFHFELKKQSTCCLQLTNKTDQYVAFKVKTTNPKKYCVRPNTGVVMPGTACQVTVTMQAQKEAPADLQCKDKFLLQSVVTEHGATTKDITTEMFNKAPDKVVEEFKLRVIYIPANPPSPVPEESEEGSSPRSSMLENGSHTSALFDDASAKLLQVSRTFEEPSKDKPSETEKETPGEWGEFYCPLALAEISKLTEEKTSKIQQNQKLRQELELLKREQSKGRGGFSVTFVAVVALLGILIGYIMKTT